jgi:glycosyltransferase A (GT-A) superfamily protein (DUF2064 family)
LIGMDTPQVRVSLIETAATWLVHDDTDVVLGLAEDGGFGSSAPNNRSRECSSVSR